MRRVFAWIATAAAAAFLLAAAAPAQTTRLTGIVGPGFTIVLLDASGGRVTQLDPGTYTIDVDDRSEDHNFHLSGPGVDELTGIGFVGKVTWTVTFRDGRYLFVCDPHANEMRGDFVVGTPPAPATPQPALRRVTATVSAAGAIGVRASSRRPGSYRVVVRDLARRSNLHLVGPGVNRKTGVAFRGTVTWGVRLRAGAYRFFSDTAPRTARRTLRIK